MRPDHSSTPNESLPPSSSANTGRPSAQQQSGSAGAAATASSRGMGGSGRAQGDRSGSGERGSAARSTKAVDVPELVLKLCKIVLKKERDVSRDEGFF